MLRKKSFVLTFFLMVLILAFSGCGEPSGPGVGDLNYYYGKYAGVIPGVNGTSEITITDLPASGLVMVKLFANKPTQSTGEKDDGIAWSKEEHVSIGSHTFKLYTALGPWTGVGSYYIALVDPTPPPPFAVERSKKPVTFAAMARQQRLSYMVDFEVAP